MTDLRVETIFGDDRVVVGLTGELDLASIGRARESIATARLHGHLVVLDTRRIEFIDSTGLGLIATTAHELGDDFALIPDERTRRLLELMGMSEHLHLLDGTDDD
jgi:anti-anti-sigma factor